MGTFSVSSVRLFVHFRVRLHPARHLVAVALQIVIVQLLHDAPAAPPVRRVVRAPERIVHGQNYPVPGRVLVPGPVVQHGHVAQVWQLPLRVLDPLPAARRVRRPQIRVEDGLQAVDRAELDAPAVHDLPAPPAAPAQKGLQLIAEIREGYALGQGPVRGRADLLQNVHLHGLGHGERARVLKRLRVQPA